MANGAPLAKLERSAVGRWPHGTLHPDTRWSGLVVPRAEYYSLRHLVGLWESGRQHYRAALIAATN